MQADERLAEELVSQSQRWGIVANWHIATALLGIYVTNGKAEKALSFLKSATDAAAGKKHHPVRISNANSTLVSFAACFILPLKDGTQGIIIDPEFAMCAVRQEKVHFMMHTMDVNKMLVIVLAIPTPFRTWWKIHVLQACLH